MYNRKIFTTHKQKTKVALCFNETLALLFGIVFFFVFFFDLPWTCKATETTTPEALKKLDGLLQSFVQNLRKVITVGQFYIIVLDFLAIQQVFFESFLMKTSPLPVGLFRKEGGDFLCTSKRCM